MIEFCKRYNCNVIVRWRNDDELWGAIFVNQSGKGLLGDIAKNDSDVIGGAFYVYLNRYNLLQYSIDIQLCRVTHALPKPGPLPYWYTPILPFPSLTWICVASAFCLGVITLIFFNRAALHMKIRHLTSQKMSVTIAILTVLKIFVYQNVKITTKSGSSLIMIGTLLAFALTIGSFYTGGLASIMTITPYDKPIDSMEKLVQSDLKWGTTVINFAYPLQNSTNPIHIKYVRDYTVLPVAQLHELVKQKKAAVVVETLQGGTLTYQPYIEKNVSKFLMIMKEPFTLEYTALISTKTWPFMAQLNRIIFMYIESGLTGFEEYRVSFQLFSL